LECTRGVSGLEGPPSSAALQRHLPGICWWGPNQELIENLDLRYDAIYLGADLAPHAIQARLKAGLPTFFYLWSPHPFNSQYSLNRIQLPAYAPKLFDRGFSDYPTDVLEKVGSKQLAEFAPAVAELLSRFAIGNDAQESMLAMIGEGEVGLSAMHAVCSWMRKESVVWQAWLPAEKGSCDIGSYAINETSCAPCSPGSSSVGGRTTACERCPAGATPQHGCYTTTLCATLSHSRAISLPPVGFEQWETSSRLDSRVRSSYIGRFGEWPDLHHAGSFQSREGQASCMNCADLGAF